MTFNCGIRVSSQNVGVFPGNVLSLLSTFDSIAGGNVVGFGRTDQLQL